MFLATWCVLTSNYFAIATSGVSLLKKLCIVTETADALHLPLLCTESLPHKNLFSFGPTSVVIKSSTRLSSLVLVSRYGLVLLAFVGLG